MITLRKCEDQEGARKKYWENELEIPESECDFELPVGTIVKPQFANYLAETTEPMILHVDSRDPTNHNNQRQAFYGELGFWIKGQFLTATQRVLLSKI